ncbi:HNH endonuclease signature motif containing protein [Flavobacterium beibuense]|uniref:HNH endonuclease signature motif containing protein n=1 Tax=Flavobacterium beibuense TaxID=657326 RepID=UPI003A908A08
MSKERTAVPQNISAELLYMSNRTCCVCNMPGKAVQIHHIDENPANNDIQNLSVLCFDCHNDTMIKGGFGRKLDKYQVIKFRDTWHQRVKSRRVDADRLASISAVTGVADENNDEDINSLDYKLNNDPDTLNKYLERILIIRNAQYSIAKTYWDTGVTAEMIKGSLLIISFLEEVLIELSTFFPKGHFNNLHPKIYFNNILAEKYMWHRLLLEPEGAGTGGSIVPVLLGGKIMDVLNELVVNMVESLSFPYLMEGDLNIKEWIESWNSSIV